MIEGMKKIFRIKKKNTEEIKQDSRSVTPNINSNKNIEAKKRSSGCITPNINTRISSGKVVEEKKQDARIIASDINGVKNSNKNIEDIKQNTRNATPNFNYRLKSTSQTTLQSKTPIKARDYPAIQREEKNIFAVESKNPKENNQNVFKRVPEPEIKEKSKNAYNHSPSFQSPNLINPCNLCKRAEGLFVTPQCTSHKYCIKCISSQLTFESSSFCTKCQNYLKTINRVVAKNVSVCAVCIAFPNYSPWCAYHQYCSQCRDFFKNHEFSHILIVENCEECKIYFKSQNKVPKKTESFLPIVSPKSRKFTSPKKEVDVFTNPISNMGEPNAVEDKYRKFANNPEVLSYLNRPTSSNKNNRLIAEVPMQAKSGGNLGNKQEVEVASNIKKVSTDAKIRVKSTPRVLYNKPGQLERILLFVNDYRNKSPIIDKSREEQDSKKINSRNNSIALLTTTCNHCKSKNEITGFLCNHNICSECLVFTCLYQIQNFSNFYMKEQGIAYISFSYRCPIENCIGDISIPTRMAFKKLDRFLKEGIKRFMCFSYMVEQDWSAWIPYFDGLDIFIPQV